MQFAQNVLNVATRALSHSPAHNLKRTLKLRLVQFRQSSSAERLVPLVAKELLPPPPLFSPYSIFLGRLFQANTNCSLAVGTRGIVHSFLIPVSFWLPGGCPSILNTGSRSPSSKDTRDCVFIPDHRTPRCGRVLREFTETLHSHPATNENAARFISSEL